VLVVPVVVVAILLLLAVALMMIGGRDHVGRSWVQPPPRELVRRALAVIPAHADARGLRQAVERVVAADPRVDVLVVQTVTDGASGITAVGPRVTLLRRVAGCASPNALRLGAARGLRQHYDAVIELSVEHSHLARRISSLLDALDDGAHVAIGSRYVPGGKVCDCGAVQRLIGRGVNAVLRCYLGLPQHDVAAPVRAYRRVAIEHALRADGHGPDFGVDVLRQCHRAALHVVEVPVTATAANSRTEPGGGTDLLARIIGWRRPVPAGDPTHTRIDVTDPAATSPAG
jgi:dolichol-phosphate mannosyltransferase